MSEENEIWSWINANTSHGRLGRLFSNTGDLILDADPGIFGDVEHGKLIAQVPQMQSTVNAQAEEIKRLRECLQQIARFDAPREVCDLAQSVLLELSTRKEGK